LRGITPTAGSGSSCHTMPSMWPAWSSYGHSPYCRSMTNKARRPNFKSRMATARTPNTTPRTGYRAIVPTRNASSCASTQCLQAEATARARTRWRHQSRRRRSTFHVEISANQDTTSQRSYSRGIALQLPFNCSLHFIHVAHAGRISRSACGRDSGPCGRTWCTDTQHVELAFDAAEDEIGSGHWSMLSRFPLRETPAQSTHKPLCHRGCRHLSYLFL
jgi:hypothetical protein